MQSKTFAPSNKEKQSEVYTNKYVNFRSKQEIKYKFVKGKKT